MKGFTIIEFLLVAAIIGILAAIAIPAYQDHKCRQTGVCSLTQMERGVTKGKSVYRKDRDCKKLHGPAWSYSEGWCYIPGTDKQERYQDTSPAAPSAGPQVN